MDADHERGSNGVVGAILLRTRRALRAQWRSTTAVAFVVAVVVGAVIGIAAGARRTAQAPDALTRALGGDPDASITQLNGEPLTAGVAKLPSVADIDAFTFMFAALQVDMEHQTFGTTVFAGTRRLGSRFIEGRPADPTDPHEFIVDRTFVKRYHARLGQHFEVVTWTREQQAAGQAFNAQPGGRFTGTLVGVVETGDELEDPGSAAVFSPALLHDDIGRVATLMAVRLHAGNTPADLRHELDTLGPDGRRMTLEPARLVRKEVRDAVNAQANATWIVALVAAIAAIVTLGQLLARHARLSPAERRTLTSLGYRPREIAVESVLRTAVPVALGLAGAVVVAAVVSGRFPLGFVRPIEPDPGWRIDHQVVPLGVLAAFVTVVSWAAVASTTASDRRPRVQPSRTGEALARCAPTPAAATGTRFALTRADGTTALGRGTFALLAVMLTGIVAATTFGASLVRLVGDKGRYGLDYDIAVGDTGGKSMRDLRALAGDRSISALTIVGGATARYGRDTVDVVGVDAIRGELEPRSLVGRLPATADEIAIGRVTARSLHLRTGDRLLLQDPNGADLVYRVVGLVVVPGIGGVDGLGEGAVVTGPGFARLRTEPDTAYAAVTMRPGATRRDADRVAAAAGVDTSLLAGEKHPYEQAPPSVVVNLARVRRVPAVIALILSAMALLTCLHALIVSVRSRRRDLAVLRAIGGNRRFVTQVVHWQATVLTLLPLVIGVPLGLAAGSGGFRMFVDRLGGPPDPATPFLVLAIAVVALLVVARLTATLPARRARAVAAARLLSEE